jgi:hypothetical protein
MEKQKSHPHIRFMILILAIAGMIAFFCLLTAPDSLPFCSQKTVAPDQSLISLRNQLAQGHTIIHAGGALIDEQGTAHPYTNALETLPLAYEQGNRFNVDPLRPRRLLLHKREIRKLIGYITQDGLTLVPLRMYINDRGKAKVELAVARGKKNYDKRRDIAKRDADRRMLQARRK